MVKIKIIRGVVSYHLEASGVVLSALRSTGVGSIPASQTH